MWGTAPTKDENGIDPVSWRRQNVRRSYEGLVPPENELKMRVDVTLERRPRYWKESGGSSGRRKAKSWRAGWKKLIGKRSAGNRWWPTGWGGEDRRK